MTMLALALGLAMPSAHSANAAGLLGETLYDAYGASAGTLDDLIVDVNAGRVLYFIVDANGRYSTLPVRALGEDLRIDLDLAGKLARQGDAPSVHFRRASRLIGQPVAHPHPGTPGRLGTIRDLEFDPASGEVRRVLLATPEGPFGVGPGVLAHGRYPPLTLEQRTYADREALGNRGWLRRKPSDERLQY